MVISCLSSPSAGIIGLYHHSWLTLYDLHVQAQQGKIAAEEEDVGEDSQFMMLAKKVTAKALQKNGESSSFCFWSGCLDSECWRHGRNSNLQGL